MARPVPRNIDKPNRNAEFVLTFLIVYYGLMFLTKFVMGRSETLMSFVLAAFAVYVVNKLTLDKPEGQAPRVLYRYVRFGKLVPGANHVKRFEI